MQPSYSLYEFYATAIAIRDLMLGIAFVLTVIIFGNVTIWSRFMPRVVYIARINLVWGFYVSLALAYLIIR